VCCESRYQDNHHLLDLCVRAQQWYERSAIPTKVKACATIGLDELLQLAGVAALTIVPDDLRALQSTQRSEAEVARMSLFSKQAMRTENMSYPSYIDNEVKYRMDFDGAEEGRAQYKLGQVRISVQCDFPSEYAGSLTLT
jgi:transaldolase